MQKKEEALQHEVHGFVLESHARDFFVWRNSVLCFEDSALEKHEGTFDSYSEHQEQLYQMKSIGSSEKFFASLLVGIHGPSLKIVLIC